MLADPENARATSKYDRLIPAAKAVPPAPTIVAHPAMKPRCAVVVDSAAAGIIRPILVGPEEKIRDAASKSSLDISDFEIVDVSHSEAAAAKGVELIHAAEGERLMKGSLHTDELMRRITAKAGGLRINGRISHVFVMDVPAYAETLFVTDAAINIFPDLDTKRDIVQNAIDLYTQAGFGNSPRVAIRSAVETVTPSIPSTIDAAALCKMADRGQITGSVLDGPLTFDDAIDVEAARIKGIRSDVTGRAQILLVLDLEAGNMLAKNLAYFAKADSVGIVLGARVPVVLTSRADSARARMASCAVAALYANARRQQAPTIAA
jgi:phosphate acetyltransferase